MSWFLLQRSGFEVERSSRPSRLLDDVCRRSADVVVLDCGDSATETASLLEALEATCPGVGVVVVGERIEADDADGVTVLPKWSEFQGLVAAIERSVTRARSRPQVAGVGA